MNTHATASEAPTGDPARLFVYGTLLPPSPVALADRLEVIGPAKVRGRLYDLGPYPGLRPVRGAEAGWVHGLLCTLPRTDPGLLQAIDAYEGYDPSDPEGSLFLRERGSASMPSGKTCPCWVYHYNRPVAGRPSIPGARWRGR